MNDQEVRVELTRVRNLTPMEGMDRIELAWLFREAPNGEPCIVAKGKFRKGELVAYFPPEHIVPDVEEFKFLERHPEKALAEGATFIRQKHRRVKPMKLRGYISHGLVLDLDEAQCVSASQGGGRISHKEGSMIGEQLGVTRWEPKAQRGSNNAPVIVADSPVGVAVPKYDLTGVRKLGDIFEWEDRLSPLQLVVTEKLHGCLRGDVLVTMAGGSEKPIRDIEAGDHVLSFNEESGEFEPQVVLKHIVRAPSDETWLRLTMDNGEALVITAEHPVLTDAGWVPAGELTEEHKIFSVSDDS